METRHARSTHTYRDPELPLRRIEERSNGKERLACGHWIAAPSSLGAFRAKSRRCYRCGCPDCAPEGERA